MIAECPEFYDSPFFVDEPGNWHLKPGAPAEVVKEFNEFMKAQNDTEEDGRSEGSVAKTFNEILKFNPYHDARGRFSTADSSTQFTYAPGKSKAHDLAIAREKERHKKQQEEKEKPRTITLNQRYKEMANNWSHMRDKGAYVEQEANRQLDAFREAFKRDDYSEEQKAFLKQRENEYADLLTEKYNDQLYREGSNPSAMMAGPAKFNYSKYERKYEAEMRSQEEYRNKQQKFIENTKKQLERMEPEDKQIARWREGKWQKGESISSDDPLAAKKLQAKLDYHVEQQQKMKDANAYYRKNGSMQGFTGFSDATNKKIDAQMQDYKDRGMSYYAKQPFQSYSLTNNNATIKATRDRLTQFQNQKQTATQTGGSTKFEGGQLVRNTDINRLQIKFDSVPDAATRQQLKSSGWRWSPKEGAWQRQLTENAERSANSILGITKSMSTPIAKGDGDMIEYDHIEIEYVIDDKTVAKMDYSMIDVIHEVDTIETVHKFNPNHDALGRFCSGSGGGGSAAGAASTAESEAKSLVSKAKKREPKLTAMLKNCAKEAGGEMVGLEYAVKGEGSLTRKIKTEMAEKGVTAKEAAASMKDVNRYTMQLTEDNFAAGYKNTMDTIRKSGCEITRVKNTLKNPNAEYRGVNTNIKNPDGSIWELQFHTAKSLEVKEVNHKLYEKQRLDTTPAAEKAELGRQMAQNAASIPTPKGIETIG